MRFTICLLMALLLSSAAAAAQEREVAQKPNQLQRHYKKWLDEEVVYIITGAERDVFLKLASDEERDAFIEQFWKRRDLNPLTPENEFREEHYRRIMHVNERYHSGKPGWMTDRGKIYIKYGPPDTIEARPTGGTWTREASQGGGITYAYPFEIWRYNHLDGIGDNIEIEFVDPSRSNQYKIARSPQEKDALLYVPGTGLTLAEEMGLETRVDRITRDHLADNTRAPLYSPSAHELPFERLALQASLMRAPEIRYKDLRSIVTTAISYDELPHQIRSDYLKLSNTHAVVPVTLSIDSRQLTYGVVQGVYRAQVSLYGRAVDLLGRVVGEFDHLLDSTYDASQPAPPQQNLLFQKHLFLKTGRYKLETVVKDMLSGKVGTSERLIAVPNLESEKLQVSSLIVASRVEKVEEAGGRFEQFALGDVRVVPSVTGKLSRDGLLWTYFQIYNVKLDAASARPDLSIQVQLLDGNQVRGTFKDETGRSVRGFNENRVIVTNGVPLKDFRPGRYKVRVEILDRLSGESTSAEANVELMQ